MPDTRFETAPDDDIGAGVDEYLFYLLTQVANRRNRDFAPALGVLGLSVAEWRALSVINRLGGCLMSELSEFTTVDRTTLTRTVDHLVQVDLVERGAAGRDRRRVRVMLTARGRATFGRAVDALKGYNLHILDGLSETDQRTLKALLQRILANIVQDPAHFQKVVNFER